MENLAVLSVPDIGRENKITEEFLSSVKAHFHFKSEFLETISRAHGKLHLLIGADRATAFSHSLPCEEIGALFHPAWMPNLGFFKTVFNENVHIF